MLIIQNKKVKIIKLFLGIFLLFILLVRCNEDNQEFEDSLIEFEKYFSKNELDSFKKNDEETAYFTIKEGKNKSFESFFVNDSIGKKVSYFFEKNRIDDFDFMTDIMLICLHRKYHEMPYKLDELIEKKKWEYNDSYYCNKKRRQKAIFLFKYFELNDTIHIIQPIKDNHIYDILCPNTFINNHDKELLNLSGIVLNKKVISDSLYYTCRIKIINSSIEKFYPMEGNKTITLGDTITISFNDAFLDYSKHHDFMFSY